jgi:dihydrofolate reductase
MPGRTRVTVHMVSSLDGFIEDRNKAVAWLETSDIYEKGIGYEGAEDTIRSIDCYVIGARTYEVALRLGWPYGDIRTIVLSHRPLPNERNSVEFHAGDVGELVNDVLGATCRNIWVAGGAATVRQFLQRRLVDEVRLAIAPILIGGGTPFFDQIGLEQPLHLKDVTAYRDGMVELWYAVVR